MPDRPPPERSDAEDARPLEAQVPPAVVGTPSDVRAAPDSVQWWRPSWRDGLQFVGWRWVLAVPMGVMLLVIAGAFFYPPMASLLLVLGAKGLLFAGAILLSLGGFVVRKAIKARKEPFCIHCGYNLTGLEDNRRCPECGEHYTWRVIDEYRRDPHWFIERWKLQRKLPQADEPFKAGAIRRKPRDGTG